MSEFGHRFDTEIKQQLIEYYWNAKLEAQRISESNIPFHGIGVASNYYYTNISFAEGIQTALQLLGVSYKEISDYFEEHLAKKDDVNNEG